MRNQIHRVADVEEALSYIYQTMMLDKKINGEPKATVFGSFNFDRPIGSGNPLEARFKVAVSNAIRNIASGRIRRLLHTPSGTISADDMPSRPDHDQAFGELIRDISSLLARKEKETKLPLIGLFNAMVAGESTAEQRRLFGARAASVGRRGGHSNDQRLCPSNWQRCPDATPRENRPAQRGAGSTIAKSSVCNLRRRKNGTTPASCGSR